MTVMRDRDAADGTPRWKFSLSLGKRSDGKRKQVLRRGFKTKKEAEAAEANVRKQFAQHTPAADGTVAAEFRSWVEKRQLDLEATSVVWYRDIVEHYIVPHIGSKSLYSLNRDAIDSFYLTLAKQGNKDGGPLSGSTVRGVHKVLMAGLRDMGVEIVGKIKVPKKKVGRLGVWKERDCITFLDHVLPDRLYAAWVLALVLGLRRGEIAGLRWSMIDLHKAEIDVSSQRTLVNVKNSSVVEKGPKGTSKRQIPLGAEMVAILTKYQVQWALEREEAGDDWHGGDYLFVNNYGRRRGYPYYPTFFTKRWKVLCQEANVLVIALHDARHSSFTVASAIANVGVMALVARAGHGDAGTLTGNYLHNVDDVGRQASEAIEGLLLRRKAAQDGKADLRPVKAMSPAEEPVEEPPDNVDPIFSITEDGSIEVHEYPDGDDEPAAPDVQGELEALAKKLGVDVDQVQDAVKSLLGRQV